MVDRPETMTCPACEGTMRSTHHVTYDVASCESCSGVFLHRGDLGDLVDAEIDWHQGRAGGPHTRPIPRITADMTAPPPAAPRAQAWVETLFGR